MNELLSVIVPAPIQSLNWGWWIIHVVAIVVIFLIGVAAGKHCAACNVKTP